MQIRRPQPRVQHETIIALIDVVFFLLVFFMLIGRLDATAPFEVTPPVAGSGTDMPGGGATLSVGADGRMALDGRPLDRTALEQSLTRLISANPDLMVRVNAHAEAELRHVLPMVTLAENLGAKDVVLVVTLAAP